MAEKESSSFPKLNGMNYHDWRFNMEWTLRKKRLWKYVDGSAVRPEPTSANIAEVQRYDEQSEIAKVTIVLAIEPLQQQHVRDCESAHDVWVKLEAAFEPRSRPRMMQLTRALIDNKCTEGEPMDDYVTRTRRLAAQLKEAGLEFKDDQLTTIMIANLPPSYDSVASAIMNWDECKYTFDCVKEALLTEYCRRQQQAAQRGEAPEALAIKPKFNSASRRLKNDREAQRRQNIVCFHCRKVGHMARQCRNKPVLKVQSPPRGSGLNVQTENTSGDVFVLDSGATRHICNRREWFSKFRAIPPSSIYSADISKEALMAEGVGTLEVTLYYGPHGALDTRPLDVLYVPKCRRNLVSVEKSAHFVVMKHGLARIYKLATRSLVAEARETDGLYILNAKLRANREMALGAQEMDSGIWHKRYCHISSALLRKTVSMNAVDGISISSKCRSSACADCIVGKSAQGKCVPLERRRSRRVLELVHSDICGPMPVKSIGGATYFMTFIDDHSRKMFVARLRTKSEAPEKLKELIALAERQMGKRIKAVRTDNGLEYCNREMQFYFRKFDIKHERSNVETPQMNGVAERANRTLLQPNAAA